MAHATRAGEGVGHPVPDPRIAVELVTRSPAQYLKMISECISLAVTAIQQIDDRRTSASRKPSSPQSAPIKKTAR